MSGKKLASSEKAIRSGAAASASSAPRLTPAEPTYATQNVSRDIGPSAAQQTMERVDAIFSNTNNLQSTLSELGLVEIVPLSPVGVDDSAITFNVLHILTNNLTSALSFVGNVTFQAINGGKPELDSDEDDAERKAEQQPIMSTHYGSRVYSAAITNADYIDVINRRLTEIRQSLIGLNAPENLAIERLSGENVMQCVTVLNNNLSELVRNIDTLNADLRYNLLGGL